MLRSYFREKTRSKTYGRDVCSDATRAYAMQQLDREFAESHIHEVVDVASGAAS